MQLDERTELLHEKHIFNSFYTFTLILPFSAINVNCTVNTFFDTVRTFKCFLMSPAYHTRACGQGHFVSKIKSLIAPRLSTLTLSTCPFVIEGQLTVTHGQTLLISSIQSLLIPPLLLTRKSICIAMEQMIHPQVLILWIQLSFSSNLKLPLLISQ